MRLAKTLILSILLLVIFGRTFAQSASTVNVSGTSSTQNITNNVATVVDPQLTVTSDGTISGFTVQITGSYAVGDLLSYSNAALPSGVSGAFNATSRSLQFTGTATAASWQTLLRTVTLQTVSATCYQEQRQVSFIVGPKFYNPLNGHFYELSSSTSFWQAGFSNAATQSYFGRLGYMATLTSQAENSFVSKILATDSWIGCSDSYTYINLALGNNLYANQAASEGKWYWISGPEKGTQMSTNNQVNISGVYNSWSGGEPNNYGGSEDYGEIYVASGNWNDLPNAANYKTIIEYGGMSTDNTTANVVFTRNLMITGAPSGTITGGNATVCTGSNSTTMTLSGLASGGSVVKWQYSYDDFLTNGVDIASSASTSYTATNITQNTYYRAVVNTTGCSGLTTSSTRITVNAAVPGNIVADNNTICNGANVNFTLNGYSGSVVKWQVSTSSTFANSITDIANTTPALSYQLSTAGTYYFRAVVLSCSNTVYTNIYTVTAIVGSAPVGGTVSSVSYCGGSNSGSLTLSGSTGNVSKWQYSTDGGIVWTDVANTTTTLNYSAIAATRQYRAVLTNGSCGTALSAAGTITVNPASVAGTASGTASVCASTNTTNVSLSGNTGSIQWQSSTNNSTFTDIAGEVAATYVAANLSATTYYRAIVTNASCTPATSNTVTVTVKQPSTSTTNANICAGGSYSFAGSNYSTTGTYVVHLNNAVGCDSAATLNLTVNPLPPTPTITPSGATTFCAGGSVTLTSDAATSYAWTGGATTQAINITASGTYTVTVSNGTCTAISAPVTVTVTPIPSALQVSNSICGASPLQWVAWSNISTASATGTLFGTIGVTVSHSKSGLFTTGNVYNYGVFPTSYQVPNSSTTIANSKSGTFTITYSSPVTNPQVAFSSIGSPGNTVGITTSSPYQVLWQGIAMNYTSSTTFTGTEGYTIVSFPGTFTTLSFTYDKDESYCNLAFGAANTSCSNLTVCTGNSVTLTATGGSAYSWSPATGLNSTNTSSVIATPLQTTTYSVIDPTQQCGTATQVVVNVSTPTAPTAAATQYYCPSATVAALQATTISGQAIQWFTVPTGGTALASTTALVSNTTYYAQALNSSGCVSSRTAVLAIEMSASAASATPSLCINTVLTNITHTTLNATGIGSPSGLPAGVSATWLNDVITISGTPTVSGTFNYTIPVVGSCSNVSATGSITVTPLPTPVISGSSSICDGSSTALTTYGGGNALTMDGSNDYVTIPRVVSGNFTIEYWMRTNRTAPGSGQWYTGIGIVDAEMPGGTNDFGTALVNNKLAFGVGNPDVTIFSTSPVNTGNWVHVAVTRTQSNGAIKLYINGVLEASGTGGTQLLTAPNNIKIGVLQTLVNGYFNGNIDELRFWNVVRTPADIVASMNTSVPTNSTGLVAYYKFDETSGASAVDATGNGNTGSLLNGPTWLVPSTSGVGSASYVNYLWSTGATSSSITVNPSSSSTYSVTVTDNKGCVNSTSFNLTVKPNSTSNTNISICPTALPYSWNGLTFTTAGTQIAHLTNSVGCDSAATLNLTVLSPSASTTVIKVPFGASYIFNGVTYNATGIYAAHLTNAVGCDSTATLDFTVDPKPSAGADQTVACGSATKSVTLTGTLPTTGAWSSMASNDAGAILGTTVNGVVEVTLPVAPFTGKLSYVYTTFGGKDTVDIYVNGPTSPVIEIHTGSPVLCTGATVQLCPLVWGFSNYQWYKDGYALASPLGASSCITIDATGIGSYTLAGTNGSGCWSQPSVPQIVSSVSSLTKPTITVSGSTALCNGGSTILTSSSASGNLWFKNGNSTGVTSQSYTVSDAADYSVLVSSGTCTSTMSLAQTITNGVKASFTTANATNNCDSTISFTSTSVGTNSTWNFGDGSIGTGNTVTHKYATTGLFTVKQAVISVGGCKDTATQTITVVSCPPPVAPTTCNITPSFNVINNTVNGGSYTYISNSTITNGNMTYFWDLGNGTTSTLISPSVTYAIAGTYQVKLVVTGDLGCKDSITQSVVVTITAPPVTPPACTAPVADFTIANAAQCLTSNAFSFSNTSTGTAPTYTWNFGDGSASVTTTAAAHSYISANTYTVTLVATNACGSNQVTKNITVTTTPATPASISGSTSITAGATTTLSSATTGGVWASNNTTVATVDANGVVSALTVGTATISYTVTNSCGSSTTSLTIAVTAAIPPVTPPAPPVCTAPVADFTIANATQCLVGNAFSFTNTSTGTAPTYTWNFGDGSASVTTTAATHSYTAANTYTITLVATNACGSNQITKTVTLQTVPPAPASISGATNLTVGATATLSSATASGVWTSNNNTVATVDANGIVTALAAGTATISYTVSNSCGTASASINITVTAAVVVPPPVVVPPTPAPCNLNASFTINNVSQCVVGNQYVFTNTTTGGTAPFTYLWDLNDGTTAGTKDVTKAYAAYGEHDVTLKVTDANGCVSNAAAQQIYVGAKPKASFTILTHTGSGQSTTFISSSTIASGTMRYLWDLGNGSTSTLVNPTTNYTPGTYTIQLIVSGIGSCKDTAVQSITELAVASVKVYPNPVMDVIQVSFVSASATPTTFKLMDLTGRVLQIQTVTPNSRGTNVLATMNTRGLQSGSYVLYISDEQNGFLATKAILKQ